MMLMKLVTAATTLGFLVTVNADKGGVTQYSPLIFDNSGLESSYLDTN